MTIEDLFVMDQVELDDLVLDLKSVEASEINNAGRDTQIAYILTCYGVSNGDHNGTNQ